MNFKNLFTLIIIVLAFMAGNVFAEADPITHRFPFFELPIEFEGEFTLNHDGTGTCNGSFAVDPEVWNEFERGAGWNGSVWTGIGEIFDGAPYGPDEDDEPAYSGLWAFITYMESHHPWPWTR